MFVSRGSCAVAARVASKLPRVRSLCRVSLPVNTSFAWKRCDVSNVAPSSVKSVVRGMATATRSQDNSYKGTPPPGMLTLEDLKAKVKANEIESVVVGFVDMYGRMMGKRFDADFFLESCATGGTHGCDYLLASDIEMVPTPGYSYANWERGYGDFHMVPDLRSLRVITWQPKTALVLCDIYDDKTHSLVSINPRSILHSQIQQMNQSGYDCMAASELEYYQYENSYRDAHEKQYLQSSLKATGDYLEDYHLLQTSREEKYTRTFMKHLKQSGIPVENSKGECGIGQHELNVKYSDILQMSDRHLIYKQCLKEVADQLNMSVTFMAKPFSDSTGSGCHIHLSLHDRNNGKNLFQGEESLGPVRCSKLFKNFLAGWLKYTPDVMVFYAPTVNSYKRFQSASWAPTRLAWSYDNRTAGYRVVGSGKSLRIECRIPGADCNPYLAFAGSLASGLAGIKENLSPPDLFEGNIYEARQLPEVPKSLHEAVTIFENSPMAKAAFGEDVVRHYTHFYKTEQAAFEKHVTDWERKRYFERI